MSTFETVEYRSYSMKEFTVQMPKTLVKRVEIYAQENDTSIANVVIDALDSFLREQRKKAAKY
jgi:hypothetical protein